MLFVSEKWNRPSLATCSHPWCYYPISLLEENLKFAITNEIHSVSPLSAWNTPSYMEHKSQIQWWATGPVPSLTSLFLLLQLVSWLFLELRSLRAFALAVASPEPLPAIALPLSLLEYHLSAAGTDHPIKNYNTPIPFLTQCSSMDTDIPCIFNWSVLFIVFPHPVY